VTRLRDTFLVGLILLGANSAHAFFGSLAERVFVRHVIQAEIAMIGNMLRVTGTLEDLHHVYNRAVILLNELNIPPEFVEPNRNYEMQFLMGCSYGTAHHIPILILNPPSAEDSRDFYLAAIAKFSQALQNEFPGTPELILGPTNFGSARENEAEKRT
jgi:hypothetical protein